MSKIKTILLSILWTAIILVFPITSGIIATVFELEQKIVFLVQGSFMLISTTIPLAYIKIAKHKFYDYGFSLPEKGSTKKVLFYIPLVLIILPRLVVGIDFQSITYTLSLLFFTLCIGISEEIYFRGIVYNLIKNSFISVAAIINISALIFGIGHGASIIGTGDIVATILQIINAFFFGVVAIETVMLVKSLYPLMAFHFIYNCANYISTATGTTEIISIAIQVILTIITTVLLGVSIKKNYHTKIEIPDQMEN
ncbi:MAG: CPBP family intramembrane metalloprotease [Clostridia bacterium]|nr:CPBP family intramembrane metalloprotease [Clostridia bacterium]